MIEILAISLYLSLARLKKPKEMCGRLGTKHDYKEIAIKESLRILCKHLKCLANLSKYSSGH